MKLERLPEYFISFIVILLGLAIALYVGLNAGTGSLQSIVLIVGGICFLIIGAVMGRYVWLLIPLSLYGPPRILGLPIGMLEAATLTAFTWWMIFAAFRKVPFRRATNAGDILLFLNLCYLVLSFARNPVGGMLIDSDRIGGRPYFAFIFACMAYWVLSRVDLNALWARRLPWLTVIGSLPALISYLLSQFIPGLAPFFNFVFGDGSTTASEGASSETPVEGDVQRASFLTLPTTNGLLTLFARFPVKTFINPLYIGRVALFALGLVLITLTGFRSAFAVIALQFLWIAGYQRILGSVLRTSLFILPLAALLIAGHGTFYTFPPAVQRTLSFLPGAWSEGAQGSATDSTDWRITIWKMILSDSQYLRNPWLGDGFGYSAQEHQALLYTAFVEKSREAEYVYFTLIGQVHSGPLSTLRFAGVAGGILFYGLLIYLAVSAHRLILRARGTPYQFITLVFGVPLVISPFTFTFIFGAYESDLPRMAIALGMLNMIRKGLDRHLREQKSSAALPSAEKSSDTALLNVGSASNDRSVTRLG